MTTLAKRYRRRLIATWMLYPVCFFAPSVGHAIGGEMGLLIAVVFAAITGGYVTGRNSERIRMIREQD